MSVLGLISSPVFADPTDAQTQSTTTTDSTSTTTTPPARRQQHQRQSTIITIVVHHSRPQHTECHPQVVQQAQVDTTARVEYKDYKDMALPAHGTLIDTHQIMYDGNEPKHGTRHAGVPDWFNRIGVSGGANFDAHWGSRHKGYEGENSQRLSLNDAYLNVGATVNDWTKAFAGIELQQS